jgi:hypothetical protein
MPTPATFRELFETWLEESIAAGGEIRRMVALVNIYQGADPTGRHAEFRDWLAETSLLCGRCQQPSKPMRAECEEDDPVLCDWCWRGGPILGLEPVPGYRRVFAR